MPGLITGIRSQLGHMQAGEGGLLVGHGGHDPKDDLTQKINIDIEGGMLTQKRAVNPTADQLSAFASEGMRVGTQGIQGIQANAEGVQGRGQT